jgi:hypothetical protein
LERLPNGLRQREPQGITELTFWPTAAPSNEEGACSLAIVETSFTGVPPFKSSDVERFNRRAVFGNFYLAENAIRLRLALSVRDRDSNHDWLVRYLLQALGDQLACGFAILLAEVDETSTASSRDNLQYPRKWTSSPDANWFSEGAERLEQWGYPHFALGASSAHLSLLLPLVADAVLPEDGDPRAEMAMLRVATDAPHPIAGAGFLCTIALPMSARRPDAADWCAKLNAFEHEQHDFVPRIGAWGLRGLHGDPVYALFLPEQFPAHPIALMRWLIVRANWLGERFWVAGKGLNWEKPAS